MTTAPHGMEPGSAGSAADGPTWAALVEIADALGIPITRVHQLLRDRQLVAVRRGDVLRMPAEFVQDGVVVKGLTGTITLLSDGGFSDEEIVEWLFRPDDTLPGTPISRLRSGSGREVHRRAQVAGF